MAYDIGFSRWTAKSKGEKDSEEQLLLGVSTELRTDRDSLDGDKEGNEEQGKETRQVEG